MAKKHSWEKKAARNQQNANRERNVGHQNGEEHSKKDKGRDKGRSSFNK